MREYKLLCLIFNHLDTLSSQLNNKQEEIDKILEKLSEIYEIDITDMTNYYLNYTWASQDEINPYDTIKDLII